jgi:hypothetical protein
MAPHDHITLPSCNRMAPLAYLLQFSAYCLAMQNEKVAVSNHSSIGLSYYYFSIARNGQFRFLEGLTNTN